MTISPNIEDMPLEQQRDYYKLWQLRTQRKLTTAEQRVAELEQAQEHQETLQLVQQAGGRSFTEASAEAADDDYTPPVMVAETNQEFVEEARQAERIRIGFQIGSLR